MASAVLAFVIAALVQAVSAGQMQAADALEDLRGLTLAESLMEEVLAKPYYDPDGASSAGPESGESSRTLYDNSDDFNNFSEAAGAIADATGSAYPQAYQLFTRRVTCAYTTATITGLDTSVPGLTVTVVVTSTLDGKTWTITRFRPEPSS